MILHILSLHLLLSRTWPGKPLSNGIFYNLNFTEASNLSGMVLSPAQCTIILHKESHLEVCIKTSTIA